MNKEYANLQSGEHLVSDEKGMRIVGHNDNIYKVLITQNELEEVENRIKVVENSILTDKSNKKSSLSLKLMIISLLISLPLILPPLFYVLLGLTEVVNTRLGMMPNYLEATITLESFASFGVLIAGLQTYFSNRNMKKRIRGEASVLRFLNQKKQDLNRELDDLHREKTNQGEINAVEKINNIKYSDIMRVDDIEVLKKLEQYIKVYYQCGYNQNKYLYHYLNGELRYYIGDKYTPEEYELINSELHKIKDIRNNLPKTLRK